MRPSRHFAGFEVQFPVLERFGFEGSRKGVAQSVAAFRPFNGHVEAKTRGQTPSAAPFPILNRNSFRAAVIWIATNWVPTFQVRG